MCVHTHSSVNIDSQTRRTLTAEGALRVDAAAVHANARCKTLVYVCAVSSIRCQRKARFAYALKAAILVDAHAVETHVGGGTLIVINAVLPIRSELKASVADTLKASLCVYTAAVATHYSIHYTLINVDAGLFGQSSLVTLMALAVVGSRCVDTVSISTWFTHTLIHIDTFSSDILSVAHVALAAVACGCGNAASVQTQVGKMFAHIDTVIH